MAVLRIGRGGLMSEYENRTRYLKPLVFPQSLVLFSH